MENEVKCCWSASTIKGSKKGGVMINILVGYERPKPREDEDDPIDKKTTNPCESGLSRSYDSDLWGIGGVSWRRWSENWLSIGHRKFCGIRG